MTFDHPSLLHLLWVIPALLGVYAFGFACKRTAMQHFASVHLIRRLTPQVSAARQKLKAACVLAAGVLLVVGLAGPRWGSRWEEVPRRGVDLLIALDVSRSMLAEDIAPNRLERAKLAVGDLLEQLAGDRIGLVTFAGVPVKKCPLTVNYSSFKRTLDEVGVESAPRGGSMIGDAVRAARAAFLDRTRDYKAVILISDGADGERASYPAEAAADAYQNHGIRVYTVGIGDIVEGARIPLTNESGGRSYLVYDGQEVWSKLHPEVLQEIAVAGHGKYLYAGTSDFDLGPVYRDIRKTLGTTEFESRQIERKIPRFQWFAAAALLLLMVETIMTERRRVARAAGETEADQQETMAA
jgi:Ca-activated chloride channel family protein